MSYNPTNGSNTNTITDTQYLDVSNGNITEDLYFGGVWGFLTGTFDVAHPNLIINVSTADEFITALTTIETNGGGTINVAAGTYIFTSQLSIPSNTLVQGDGKNTTIMKFNKADTDGIKIKHKTNIVFRDLTWDGQNIGRTGITVWYASNVLFERIILKNWGNSSSSAGSGITFRYVSLGTIRFITSNNNQFHGISSKDHFCSSCTTVSDLINRYVSEADLLDGNSQPLYGVPFTEKCLIHSNVCNNSVAEYGIDWHGQDTEICGNQFTANADGAKFPDAQRLVIHNNIFENSPVYGLWFYNSYTVVDRLIEDICVFDNIIRNNAKGFRAQHGSQVHIRDNTWTGNTIDVEIGPGGATVTTCFGSYEETTLGITQDNFTCTDCEYIALATQTADSTYTITNNGPDDATNVVFTFTSGGATIDHLDIPAGASETHNSSVAIVNIPLISAASSVDVRIWMEAPLQTFTGHATVVSNQGDSNPANNEIYETINFDF